MGSDPNRALRTQIRYANEYDLPHRCTISLHVNGLGVGRKKLWVHIWRERGEPWQVHLKLNRDLYRLLNATDEAKRAVVGSSLLRYLRGLGLDLDGTSFTVAGNRSMPVHAP